MEFKITGRQDAYEILQIKEFGPYILPSDLNIASIEGIAESDDKRPDFYLSDINAYVEIKRIVDYSSVNATRQFSKILKNIEMDIESSKKRDEVKGFYVVSMPYNFKHHNTTAVADGIVESIIRGENQFIYNEQVFGIEQVSAEKSVIIFTATWGGPVNVAGVLQQSLFGKTSKKEDGILFVAEGQLGWSNTKYIVDKRILLLVNEYDQVESPREIIEAIAGDQKLLLNTKNLDEIWFMLKTQQGNTVVKIWDRCFLQMFIDHKLKITPEQISMIEKWIYALLQNERKDQMNNIFFHLKNILDRYAPYDVFRNADTRIAIVNKLGDWLLEWTRYDDLDWLIDHFIDDPDPSDNDYYSNILAAEQDPVVIATVQGNVAWGVSSLTRNQAHIIDALSYTEKLFQNPNQYIRYQALFPLLEVTKRRCWLKEYDKKNDTDYYNQLRALIFDVINRDGKNPVYARLLSEILYCFKDVTEEDAKLILNVLLPQGLGAYILIYYALYRQEHFQKTTTLGEAIPWNPNYFESELKRIIQSTNIDNEEIRNDIIQQFARILPESIEAYARLRDYIAIIFDMKLNTKNVYSMRYLLSQLSKISLDDTFLFTKKLIINMRDTFDFDGTDFPLFANLQYVTQILEDERPEQFQEILSALDFLPSEYIERHMRSKNQ